MPNVLKRAEVAMIEASKAAAVIMECSIRAADVLKSETGLTPSDMARWCIENIAKAAIMPLEDAGYLDDDGDQDARWSREDEIRHDLMTMEEKAAMVDDSRPPEWARREDTVPSTPWREREKNPGEQPECMENSPVVVDHGVSKMVESIKAEGFESDGPMALFDQIEVFVHEKSEHRVELNKQTGRFRAVSGYDLNVATGEGAEDLAQWISEEV